MTGYPITRIFINGGKRGFLVEIASQDLKRAVEVEEVAVAIPQGSIQD